MLSPLVSPLLLHPSAATHPGAFVPVLKDSTSVHEIEYGLRGSWASHKQCMCIPSEVLKSFPPVYLSCVTTYM